MTYERGNWLFELIEEYSQFFDDCNWYTYRFAHLEFENDSILGAYEGTIVILGIGIRVRWSHTETETMAEIKRRVETIKDMES
jgi:hypothetical protein